MSIQNIILLIAGAINLIMSIIVFSRGVKNKVNLYFGLLTLSNFLWATGLFSSRFLLFKSDSWFFWSQFTYVAALCISVSLFYFSIYFPFKLKNIKKIYNYLIFSVAIFLAITLFIDNLFFVGYVKDVINNIYILYFNNLLYIVYSIYFFILALISVCNFYHKQRTLEGIFRKQVRILLVVIIVGLFFGAYFDLFLCYFNNFIFNWFGPLFTLPMNFVAFYLVYMTKEK